MQALGAEEMSLICLASGELVSGRRVRSAPVQLLLGPLLRPAAQQQHAEGLPEGLVAESVAHRVNGAVNVTQPVPQMPERQRDAVGAEGGDQHHDVVRRPCEDEGQEDRAESLRRLLLLDQNHPLPLSDLALQRAFDGFGGRRGGRRVHRLGR